MSTKAKLYRSGIAVFFATILLFPFHLTARTAAAPLPSQEPATPTQSRVKTGVIAGKGLKGRRVLESDASASVKGKMQSLDLSKLSVAPQVVATSSSVLTGTGAIVSNESQTRTGESVFMPANIAGTMVHSNEQDVYQFPVLAGQQVTVDAFAARIGSEITADIGLFDASGNLIGESVEDQFGDDPFIQFTPTEQTTLTAVIEDEFGFTGSGVFYILNIEAGVDVSPNTPPDTGTPDQLGAPDVSVFGNITSPSEVDKYSFTARQGQTLIAAGEASVYGGSLVSQLQLIDAATKITYFTSSLVDGGDPRFNIVIPTTGTYIIAISPIQQSTGEYDLNLSLVPSTAGPGAPTLISAEHTKPKLIQVTGTQLSGKSIVEANSLQRPTQRISKGNLQAKVTGGTGTVITVVNKPDLRRSNPIILP